MGDYVDNVVSIVSQEKKIFNLEEARNILPLVLRITAEIQREVSQKLNRLESIKYGSSEAAQALEKEIQDTVQYWQSKVSRLGAHPKGLWIADFDHGQGYFCWKYPESDILYSHGYHEGFSGRQEIANGGALKPVLV